MIDPLPTVSEPLIRPTSVVAPTPDSLPNFLLGSANRSYRHQYANIYFIRLRKLREFVERNAIKKWENVKGKPKKVLRVLDVKKGELCWIMGTVYMEMPLKPNILEDIGKDFSIVPSTPPSKYHSSEDMIVLEDESGRIVLVGNRLKREQYVTGVIMAALGIETPDGEFEVADVCFAGMAPQVESSLSGEPDNEMDVDESPLDNSSGSWIALLSGLELSASHPVSPDTELRLQLLIEHILAESGGPNDQKFGSEISRVIIVGNSLLVGEDHLKLHQNSPSEPVSSPATSTFAKALQELALAVPVHLLPGDSDPSGTILPQQPMPRAMFGEVRNYMNFKCETNPTWLVVDGQTLLVTSGQTIDDMYKYLETDERLSIAQHTLEWRHMAPTAPDTLWCHPYSTQDPFLLPYTPHIYVVGNQPSFATRLVTSIVAEEEGKPSKKRDTEGNTLGEVKSRIVLLPRFSKTPTLVLVHTRTLECRTIEIGISPGLLPRES